MLWAEKGWCSCAMPRAGALAPRFSSAFSLWQLFSQALDPDRRPSALSGLWSQAFRLGLSSSQMQM